MIHKTVRLGLAKAGIQIPDYIQPEELGWAVNIATNQKKESSRRVRLGLPMLGAKTVRLSTDWERVTISRGPNKGKQAWKKGNRYFHGEKPPEGRSGAKAETGGKATGKAAKTTGKAAKAKPQKASPQDLVAKHKSIMESGKVSSDDVQSFVDDLLSMTVKDINEVKKSLGVKASGKKSELAAKIGQLAFELVKPSPKKSGPSKPAKGPSTGNARARAIDKELTKQKATTKLTPASAAKTISDNLDRSGYIETGKLRELMGNPENFDQIVGRMAEDGVLYAYVDNHAELAPEAERNKMLKVGNNYYVEVGIRDQNKFNQLLATDEQQTQGDPKKAKQQAALVENMLERQSVRAVRQEMEDRFADIPDNDLMAYASENGIKGNNRDEILRGIFDKALKSHNQKQEQTAKEQAKKRKADADQYAAEERKKKKKLDEERKKTRVPKSDFGAGDGGTSEQDAAFGGLLTAISMMAGGL